MDIQFTADSTLWVYLCLGAIQMVVGCQKLRLLEIEQWRFAYNWRL